MRLLLALLISSAAWSVLADTKFSAEPTAGAVFSVNDQFIVDQTNKAKGNFTTRRGNLGDLPQGVVGQSINLERFDQVLTLFKSRNTVTTPISIVLFGDSTSEDNRSAGRTICDQLALNYGYQDVDQDNSRNVNQYVTTTGAASLLNVDANWWIPHYILTTSDSLTYSNNLASDGTIPLNAIRVPYLQWTNGGTFRIDFDNPLGTWTPAVTINANVAAYIGENITNVLVTIAGAVTATHFRIVNLTGTNYLAQFPGLVMSASLGTSAIRSHHLGQGGFGMDTFNSCNTNVQASCWSNLAPDLVIVGLKNNNQATTAPRLWTFYSSLTNTIPKVLCMFVGTTPSANGSYLDWPLVNATERAFCQSNGLPYMDVCSLVPAYDLSVTNADTNWMALNGFFTGNDGIHATTELWNYLLQPVYALMGINSSQNPSGYRMDRLFVGAPVDGGPTNVFKVGNPVLSGGVLAIRPAIGQTSVSIDINDHRVEYGDGLSMFHYVGASGQHFFLYNGGSFAGQTTPSGSWYFGPQSSVQDFASGNVRIDGLLGLSNGVYMAGTTLASTTHTIRNNNSGAQLDFIADSADTTSKIKFGGNLGLSGDGQTLNHYAGASGGNVFLYNAGSGFAGRTTPSGSWYFGTASSPADLAAGNFRFDGVAGFSNTVYVTLGKQFAGNGGGITNISSTTKTSAGADVTLSGFEEHVFLGAAHSCTLGDATTNSGHCISVTCTGNGTNAILTILSQTIAGATKWTNTVQFSCTQLVSDGSNWQLCGARGN